MKTALVEILQEHFDVLFSGAGMALLGHFLGRRQRKADVDSRVVETADKVVELVKEEIIRKTENLHNCENELAELKLRVSKLEEGKSHIYPTAN